MSMKKGIQPIVYLIVVVVLFYLFGPPHGAIRLFGSAMGDLGIYGFEDGISSQLGTIFQGTVSPEEFKTLDDMKVYAESKYSPNQSIHFNCLNPDGTGGFAWKTTVSKMSKYSCDQGYMYIYKWELP